MGDPVFKVNISGMHELKLHTSAGAGYEHATT